jgi:hypothetical protein
MMVVYLEEKAHVRVSDGFTKLIKLGIGVLLICHWIGSFNFMMCRLYEFPDDSWVVQTEIHNAPASVQWQWSFFKAMAMMIMIGFETPPFTNVGCNIRTEWCAMENWITLVCLYMGAIFYSLLISSVASILNSSNMSNRSTCRQRELRKGHGGARLHGVFSSLRRERALGDDRLLWRSLGRSPPPPPHPPLTPSLPPPHPNPPP